MPNSGLRRARLRAAAAGGLGAGLILAGVWAAYEHARTRLLDAAETSLAEAADAKSAMLVEWRRDLVLNARPRMHSPANETFLKGYLAGSPGRGERVALLRWMSDLMEANRAEEAMLLDTRGKTITALDPDRAIVEDEDRHEAARAIRAREPFVTDIHLGEGDGVPHVDLIVPLEDRAGEGLAAFLLRLPTARSIEPLLSRRAPGRFASETLLLRRAGEDFLYLSDTRDPQRVAVRSGSLRAEPRTFAARAAAGEDGFIAGADETGRAVFAVARPVPGTPWRVAAVVPKSEVLAELGPELAAVAATAAGALAALAFGLASWLGSLERRSLSALLDERRRAEAEARREAERLRALLDVAQSPHGLTEQQFLEYAADKAVEVTGSRVGYIHEIDEDRGTIRLVAWSKEAIRECAAAQETHYSVDKAGIWADAFRKRAVAVHNDYQALDIKRTLPLGHTPVFRHMSAPIFDQAGRARMVVGVGNRETPYGAADVRALELAAREIWRTTERRRACAAALERAVRPGDVPPGS